MATKVYDGRGIMKFGILFANTGQMGDPESALGLAKAAKDLGFESLWASQHVVIPSGYSSPCPYTANGRMPGGDEMPIPDPLIWLGYVAAVTDRIRLATGAVIAPLMNPVVLAKQVATLDHLSGGRVDLGIGLGWMREEFEALGVPFDGRGPRTDEYIGVMRALWSGNAATYHGRHIDFDDCIMRPAPHQNSVPIHIGGDSVAAARRAGRLGDGYLPMTRDAGTLRRLLAETRNAAAVSDRDMDDIEVTVTSTLIGKNAAAELEGYRELGVDRILVPAGMFFTDLEAGMRRYRDEVMAPMNGDHAQTINVPST